MRDNIALGILSAIASGTYTTRELIRASGHSPNTVIRYLDDLEERGLIERVKARKAGLGRPPIVLRATQRGLSWMRDDQISVFTKLHGKSDALWGPKRSFSFWGVPLYGRPDVFAKKRIDASPFELVVERNPPFYEHSVETDSGVFPALESLATWASTSDNPRYLGAAAVLLTSPKLDIHKLKETAAGMGTWNRLGFLASLAGADKVAKQLPSPGKDERMLAGSLPVDNKTAELAHRWRVINPISGSVVTEMVGLYGNPK